MRHPTTHRFDDTEHIPSRGPARTVRYVRLLLAAAALTACGGAQTPATGGPGATGGIAGGGNATPGSGRAALVVMEHTVADLSGALTVHATYDANVTEVPPSCTALAQQGMNGAFDVPNPAGRLGGHTVDVSVAVAPYHGPGQYGAQQIASPGRIVVDGTQYTTRAPATVTVQANGDGSAAFDAADASGRVVHAGLTWTCLTPNSGIVPPSPSTTGG